MSQPFSAQPNYNGTLTHTHTHTHTHAHSHAHAHTRVMLLFSMQQTVNVRVIAIYVDPGLQNTVIVFMLPWLANHYDINKVSCIRLSGIGGPD